MSSSVSRMPASAAAAAQRLAASRSGRRRAPRRARGAGSGTRRRPSPRPAPSRRRPPWRAPGSESGSSRAATAYIASPPGPERAAVGVGAAAQRPVEGVAVRVGEPGQHHAAAAGRVAGLGAGGAAVGRTRRGRDAVAMPRRRRRTAGSQRVGAARPARHQQAVTGPSSQVGEHRGQRRRRPPRSRSPPRAPRGVRDAGRVADEEHRRRDPGGGEDARVVAGAGRQQRARRRAVRPAVRRGRGRTRVRSVHDSSAERPAARRRRRPRRARTPPGVLAAGVEPGRDVRRDGVDPVGGHPDLAAGRHGVVALGRGAGRQDDVRRRRASGRRGRPAGSCPRGRPARPGRCASGRAGRWPCRPPTARPRSTSARPCSTCSSTNVPIRRSASGSGPSRRVGPPRRTASAIVVPVAVGEPGAPARRSARR